MPGKETKYVVVAGSLLSGIGKGIVTASITKILQMHGYNSLPMKFDGYLNYDCGTMNPYRHGEVFVLDDGSEVDMDFGEYERMINRDLDGSFSLTGGKVFSEIISMERKGEFLGRDVQFIPHVTDLIIKKVEGVSKKNSLDVLVIEVGGTLGDIENSYFMEAMRQLSLKNKVVFVDLTYVPVLSAVGEQKTKPTQIALRGMMQLGVQPDFVICRSEDKLKVEIRGKIASFANLETDRIIDDHDIGNVYRIPLNFMEQGFDKTLIKELGLENREIDSGLLKSWEERADATDPGKKKKVTISIVGKYMDLHDSYKSVKEAIIHGAASNDCSATVQWIESDKLEKISDKEVEAILAGSDGIIVPGGFGSRGIEGMIRAIRFAREKKMPYLGICLGMQLMVVEFARNVCGLKDANSAEFDEKSTNKVIALMESQKGLETKGGNMRLGSWKAKITKDTQSFAAYGMQDIAERHRHRYEFNNDYRDGLSSKGLVLGATTPDGKLVEMVEWKGQFGIGTQAHPELKSKVERPAPLFVALLKAAVEKKSSV